MKRDGSGRSREGSTADDAVLRPRLTPDQIHHLRDALKNRALETLARQRGEVRPRRHRRPKASVSPTLRTAKPAPRQSHRPTMTRNPRPKALPNSATSSSPAAPAFEYWDFPSETAVRETPPAVICGTDRAHFQKLLDAGADPSTEHGEQLFVFIGLDFGTSSTKTIVRLPFEAGEPTIAIPAPLPCRSGSDSYLWQTVLWLREEGSFRPWPEPGATVLHSLKQGLIQGRGETNIAVAGLATAVNRSQTGTAYLAFVLRYAKGWLRQNRPDLFRGRAPVWLVNLGMPTASYDDPQIARSYRRIGAAALLLARTGTTVTVETTQTFLDDPDVVEAGATLEADGALAVTVVPEAAAEMTGFSKSTRGAPGLYFLVDVGAMTLDACMFRLNRAAGAGDLYAFMAAQVRPLGVDSLHWFLAEGKTQLGLVEQCDRMLRAVVWDTKQRRDPAADAWRPGNEVPVFLAGGGAANELHRDIVNAIGPWLSHLTGNAGIRLLPMPVPAVMELPEPLQDFGRMAVAWGLSYPRDDIGEIQAMSDIEDIPPPRVVDWTARYPSKEQVC